ncbi:MAG: penicillin-binding protein 2 [Deltaproteobacteria bacterium]|nr:penicillin-binding protein 2 [Deltaproteobacteria bacterium]MBW2661597.1 penicillin-binding protein 2 [Deltaproteobacteria bacterium]
MGKYLKTADSGWYRQRLTCVALCVVAVFVVLIARLFYLQIIEGEEFRRLSENNCIRLQSIEPPRGLIYDRNGILIVDNCPFFDLTVVLKDARPVEHTIEKLFQYINIPASDLKRKIKYGKGISFYTPVVLKQDIGRDALAVIEAHKFDLSGVGVKVRPRRHYINRRSAAHLIGYLGEINSNELKSGKYPGCRAGDFIGKFGVEKAYEDFLRGKHGGRQVEVNATGQVVRILETVEAQAGHNIFLTIDQPLQQKAEELLEGVAGAVVAMDPTTGDILAMASSPSFDQNAFVKGMSHEEWNSLISNPFRPMENKAVQAEYPPASTYKIITAIAGIEEGIIDENTTFYCPGHYKYGDREFRCWKKTGHGSVNVIRALAESCDVFFYQVGQKLGVDRLAWYAKACGLGSPTGINLDNEASGLIPTAAWKNRYTGIAWQKGETLSIAIGQGYNLVTPIQMLVLISAVANNGKIYTPSIIKKIETAEGKLVHDVNNSHENGKPAGRLPAGPQTLKLVKKGLLEAVNKRYGTARIAHIDGIDISGKTGTVQLVSRKTNDNTCEEDRASHLKAHAWFVAYAPSDNSKIAVVVIVEHGEHGSSAAAPIARELISTYLGGMDG